MAIIKTSSIVSAIAGSIGGVTFSRGRTGAIAKQRAHLPKRNTPRQLSQRALIADSQRRWRALTDQQRNLWRDLAQTFSAPPNPFGEPRQFTPLQLYTYMTATAQTQSVPPTVPPSLGRYDARTTIFSVALDSGGPMTVIVGSPPVGFNAGMRLYGARSFADHPPASYAPGRLLFAGFVQSSGTTNLWPLFTAALGEPQIGEYVRIYGYAFATPAWYRGPWYAFEGPITP